MRKIVTDTDFWGDLAINVKARWGKARLEYGDIIIAKSSDQSAARVALETNCHLIQYDGRKHFSKQGQILLGGCYSDIVDIPSPLLDMPQIDFACFDEPEPMLVAVVGVLTNGGFNVKTFTKTPFPDYRNSCGRVSQEDKLDILAISDRVLTNDWDFASQLWVSRVPAYLAESFSFTNLRTHLHKASVGEIEAILNKNDEEHDSIVEYVLKNRTKEACLTGIIKECLNI